MKKPEKSAVDNSHLLKLKYSSVPRSDKNREMKIKNSHAKGKVAEARKNRRSLDVESGNKLVVDNVSNKVERKAVDTRLNGVIRHQERNCLLTIAGNKQAEQVCVVFSIFVSYLQIRHCFQ